MTPTPTQPVASAAKAMYYFSFSAFLRPPTLPCSSSFSGIGTQIQTR